MKTNKRYNDREKLVARVSQDTTKQTQTLYAPKMEGERQILCVPLRKTGQKKQTRVSNRRSQIYPNRYAVVYCLFERSLDADGRNHDKLRTRTHTEHCNTVQGRKLICCSLMGRIPVRRKYLHSEMTAETARISRRIVKTMYEYGMHTRVKIAAGIRRIDSARSSK
jgi:hypothetical protein